MNIKNNKVIDYFYKLSHEPSDYKKDLVSNNSGKPYSIEYGYCLYNYVLTHKPKIIVEFGCSWGFTTIYMAKALREIGGGKIWTCDNEISRIESAKANFKLDEVDDLIDIHFVDYNEWFKTPFEFDLCYIDLHNDGKKLQTIFENEFFKCQILKGKKVLFEGGSSHRNRIAISRNAESFDLIKYRYNLIFGNDWDRKVISEINIDYLNE